MLPDDSPVDSNDVDAIDAEIDSYFDHLLDDFSLSEESEDTKDAENDLTLIDVNNAGMDLLDAILAEPESDASQAQDEAREVVVIDSSDNLDATALDDIANIEMLNAFKEEIIIAYSGIGSALELLSMPDANFSLLSDISTAWEDVSAITLQLAEILQWDNLASCCIKFSERLALIAADNMPVAMEWAERLDAWMFLFQDAIARMQEPSACDVQNLFAYVVDDEIWAIQVALDNKDESDSEVIVPTLSNTPDETTSPTNTDNLDASLDDNLEMLNAFKEEIIIAYSGIGSALELLSMPDASFELLFNITTTWEEVTEITLQLAQMLQWDNLETCCIKFAERLALIDAGNMSVAMEWAERLDAWMFLFRDVIERMQEPSACDIQDLFEYVIDDEIWFVESNVVEQKDTGDIASEHATVKDVSLVPEDEVHPDVLHEFLQEAEDHAANFSGIMQKMHRGEYDRDTLATAQRIAHTLKGAANTTGYRGIANLTHRAEDLLEYIYQHKLEPPQELLVTLMDVADCLEIMVEHIQGHGEVPVDAVQILQQLMQWHALMQQGGLRDTAKIAQMQQKQQNSQAGQQDENVETVKTVALAEPSADDLPSATAATTTSIETLRIPTELVDALMRYAGEITILMGQVRNRFGHLMQQAQELNKQEFTVYQNGIDLDGLMSARGMALMHTDSQTQTPQTQIEKHNLADSLPLDGLQDEWIKTPILEGDMGFDPLEMDQYNELHSGLSRLLESIADTRTMAGGMQSSLEEMDALLLHQNRLHSDLQDSILQTRMMPFAHLELRLQRIVRQAARKTGKEVLLYCSGMNLMMDTDVLNKIADPLMHILRNAVDHGIESSDERLKQGKPLSGIIRLDISHIGSDILIRCNDDGRGLDFAAIRASANKKGLIRTGQELSNDELARMTLLPGFSTRTQTTQLSGRGFGMDIVFQTISQLKGRLQLFAEQGEGLTLELHLPITLMTVHSVLVESQKQHYAIPSRDVLRVLNIGEGGVQALGDELGFAFEGRVYPLHDLGQLLWGGSAIIDAEKLTTRLPLIIRADEKEQVILVENIHSCQELIMKSMGHYVPHIRGISGASILHDSSVASVLDIAEMLRAGGSAMGAQTSNANMTAELDDYAEEQAKETTVMIVDDSLSVRQTLSRLMLDMGYRTILAMDGLEAISMMEQEIPDIMLLDLELPRMNGLELASYLRKQDATHDLPIIMITSRATNKHRERAAQAGVNHYLVKPYQEDEVLHHIERLLGERIANSIISEVDA